MLVNLKYGPGGTIAEFRTATLGGNFYLGGQLKRWPQLIWSNAQLRLQG